MFVGKHVFYSNISTRTQNCVQPGILLLSCLSMTLNICEPKLTSRWQEIIQKSLMKFELQSGAKPFRMMAENLMTVGGDTVLF